MTKALALRSPGTQLLTLFFLLAFSGGLFAQATLSVQGVLTKSDGTAVDDGNYPITFRLWTEESGGNMVHEETIQQVETTGGVYSALLGKSGFQPTATFSQVYYLGVSVNGGSELAPRPRLTHAPYTMAVIGTSNKFTSSGTVDADAIKVPGGVPATGNANKGYSFGTGGDPDGGLFSYADDHVGLFTNAGERIKVTSGQTDVKNTFYGYGKVHASNGFFLHNNGSSTDVGMYSPNGSSVGLYTGSGVDRILAFSDGNNYYKTTGTHVFQTGNMQVDNNLTVNGAVNAGLLVRTDNLAGNGGFTFRHNNFNDDDTGLFGIQDGWSALYANGTQKIRIEPSWISLNAVGGMEINMTGANDYLYINGMKPKGTTGNARNLAIDMSNGRVFEESSSRRYKTNIRTLNEDFRLILKSRPVIYNRFEDPADIDTSKFYELGYIAEEMDSIGLHKLVQRDPDGQIGSFDYTKMILYAVEVLKMQDAAVATLQAEVAALKAEKTNLTAENTALKNQQAAFSAQLEALSKRMNSLENTGATGMRK